MAFALQLLLTNLGVALGLSALGWAIAPSGGAAKLSKNRDPIATNIQDQEDAIDEDSSGESAIPPVSHLLGLGVTLTLAPVLFATAFLSTTFSGILQLPTGLIFGLILWSAYMLVLIWISSITVSGILDFVLGTATEGIRRLFLGVAQVFQTDDAPESDSTEDLQRTIGILSDQIKQTLSEQKELPVLLAQQREMLLKEICDRTNLNQDQAESVLDSIQSESDKADAQAANINTGDISAEVTISASDSDSNRKSEQSAAALTQMLPNWRDLLRMAVSRVDTTDLDIETAWNTFQNFVGDDEAADFNIVALDAENYLREAPVYSLQAETLPEEFAERIYDPEADPMAAGEQIQRLEPSDFSHWLQERGDLAEAAVEELTDKLTAVRAEVLAQVETAAESVSDDANELADELSSDEAEEDVVEVMSEEDRTAANSAIALLQNKLNSYFRYTSLSKLSAQSVEDKLNDLTEEIDGFSEKVNDWIRHDLTLDFEAIAQTISKRKGIKKTQKEALTDALKDSWNSYREPQTAVPLAEKMRDYLQSIDWSEAKLEDFKGEVVQQLKVGIASQRGFSESFDPGRLVSSLSIPAAVKADLFALIRTEGKPLLRRPRRWVERAANTSQDWGEKLAQQVAQSLAHQDLSDKPEQIVREASRVLQFTAQSIPAEKVPELGAEFWQQVLAHRPDLKDVDVQSMVSRLNGVWQSTTQTLPQLREQIKEQGVEQWEDLQAVAQSLTHFVNDDVLDPVLEAVPGLDKLLEPTKQKFVAALDLAQDSFQKQTALVAKDLQQKAEQVRRQVAIAAWWLFISLFTSGAAAAAGGWLAVWVSLRA